jgi:hypothetical protein
VEPEPDREADGAGDGQAPHQQGGVGQGPAGQDGAPGDGPGAEPVHEALLQVLGHPGGRAHAGEQQAGGDEPRDQEVDVAEDQQEQGALDGPDDHQLGRASSAWT